MKILGSSLFVCFLIVLAYLKQCTEDDPLQSLLPFSSSRTHHGESQQTSLLHSSDASRPRIELHPEDHVYRGPLTQHLDWLITWDNLRPDGVQKRVYLINGEAKSQTVIILLGTLLLTAQQGLFPGPTIEARSGDTLVISVKNALEDESISIHWHGLHVHCKPFYIYDLFLKQLLTSPQIQWMGLQASHSALSPREVHLCTTLLFPQTRVGLSGIIPTRVSPGQMDCMGASLSTHRPPNLQFAGS